METFHQSGFSVVSPLSERLPSFSPMASHLRCPNRGGITAKISQRYQFSSALKRMAVVAKVSLNNKPDRWVVFCKGAPEVLQKLLAVVPKDYESTFLHHMRSGRRVIALSYRLLDGDPSSSLPVLTRSAVEADLHFLGFLVFNSALKPATKSVIRALRATRIPIAIVTGDNVYTAADVAQKLSIISSAAPLLVLEEHGPSIVRWRVARLTEVEEAAIYLPFRAESLSELGSDHTVCVTGEALAQLELSCAQSQVADGRSFLTLLRQLCPHAKIFARVNPMQKELITRALNLEGHHTLFCGDGTNDCGISFSRVADLTPVGALKAAHVGVSIINNLELEKKVQETYADQNTNTTSTKVCHCITASLTPLSDPSAV
jgi:manganese-transporting P-type ATPase